jgi:hypothetical protein
MIDRRAFLAVPLAAHAQQTKKVYRIGYLSGRSALSIVLAMWLVGCGGTAAVPAGTASAPPPFVERVHPDFWSAVAALDFDGAGRLAENTSQREFLDTLAGCWCSSRPGTGPPQGVSSCGSAIPSSAPGQGTDFPSLCSSTRQMRGRLSPRRSPGQLGFAVGAMGRWRWRAPEAHAAAYAGAVLHVGGERVRFGELLARPLRAWPSLGRIDGVL